jgi:hypothetical protein
LRLEPSERWTERILAYETLLNASDEQLKELTSNRILIVGDLRESRSGFQGDWHPVRYGPRTVQDVPGCYLLADAVAGLLERGYVVAGFPPPPTTYLILLASAAVGCWVPRRLAGRGLVVGQRSIRPLWLALTFALAGGLALAEVGDQFVTVHLGLAAATICLPLAGSLWVEYARNRHWLAGAQPQDANPRFFDAKRTLTLPSKRRKERPAA